MGYTCISKGCHVHQGVGTIWQHDEVGAYIDRVWDSLTLTPTPRTAEHKEDLESSQGLVKVVVKVAEN